MRHYTLNMQIAAGCSLCETKCLKLAAMDSQITQQPAYLARKSQFDNMITLYGRKPVLEILLTKDISVHRLHLAKTNKSSAIVDQIQSLATARNIDIRFHDKSSLSRISRNARQDQGVAIDLEAPGYQPLSSFVPDPDTPTRLLLLDRVTNPQNVGMIIRSVAAAPGCAVILPGRGAAKIDPLVFKASAGTLLRARIYHCADTPTALEHLKSLQVTVFGLCADGNLSFADVNDTSTNIFVLGNESEGLDDEVLALCDGRLAIPLANQVESLNVSAVATLIAFRGLI